MTFELGLYITHANALLGPDLANLLEVAESIDEAGVDYLTVADHVLLGTDLRGHEALGAALPFPPDEPYPDPMVVLAAIAAVTRRIRLTTGIFVAPLRSAAVLAKMAATLDVISGGRFDLGVGSGWQDAEFEAVGVPTVGKAGRMEDVVRACQRLWRDQPATYSSPYVSFSDVYCSPQPVRGDIPVWFAGRPNPPTMRRVAALGAGWLPLSPLDPDEIQRVRGELAAACDAVGRDATSVGIRMPLGVLRDGRGAVDIGAMTDQLSELAAAGVTGVHFPLARLAQTSDGLAVLLDDLHSLSVGLADA
jgi:probable F420-dependent oxidoreductase